ncbi:MAG: nicotinate-nicotinamide nucleotide adenylyltransferase [candidate division NC10 bacterium]|nr:nicotinate-nicotinamide nucleotide adenylyltransferase [candidate division NC10 bacterium]
MMRELLSGLDPGGPPRLAFARRAPGGIAERPGQLLCLSASFNPLTVAHVWLIQEASRIVPPGEILLLLASANVDKAVTGFPLERRLNLMVRFAESRPTFSVAACSHGRFVDKAEAIRPHYPAGTRLTFIVGFDTLVRLFDPKYYADRDASLSALFGGSAFIAANRAPDPPEAVTAFLARPDVVPYAHRIRVIQLPPEIAVISATDIRARLARGEPVTGLVPPEILSLLTA